MRRLLFKNVQLKAFFQRFILKVVRGYIVHLVFEPQSAKICLTFCMQKIRILTELSPAQRKPHGLNSIFRLTHVLCQEWSCRYFLRHETKNWSHFTLSCCYIAGIPTTLFLIWGKPSCFLYETVSCLLKGDPMFRFKIFFCKNKFLKILRTCWYMTWGIFVNISSFISSIKYLYGSHLRQKTPHMVHMG